MSPDTLIAQRKQILQVKYLMNSSLLYTTTNKFYNWAHLFRNFIRMFLDVSDKKTFGLLSTIVYFCTLHTTLSSRFSMKTVRSDHFHTVKILYFNTHAYYIELTILDVGDKKTVRSDHFHTVNFILFCTLAYYVHRAHDSRRRW